MILSKRLLSAVKYVRNFNCLADCGTDHGLFPIFAIENNYVKKAIASDNKTKPLKNAEKNIEERGLVDKIKTVLADGLPYLNSEIDIVSILGLGGILMSEILGMANLENVKRLVLSPNSEAYTIRKWLESNDYKIINEEMVEDRHKYYQIIIAEKGNMKLSEVEKEFGPILINTKNQLLFQNLESLIKKLQKALQRTINEESKNDINKRIETLKEVLK